MSEWVLSLEVVLNKSCPLPVDSGKCGRLVTTLGHSSHFYQLLLHRIHTGYRTSQLSHLTKLGPIFSTDVARQSGKEMVVADCIWNMGGLCLWPGLEKRFSKPGHKHKPPMFQMQSATTISLPLCLATSVEKMGPSLVKWLSWLVR